MPPSVRVFIVCLCSGAVRTIMGQYGLCLSFGLLKNGIQVEFFGLFLHLAKTREAHHTGYISTA